MPKVIKEKYVKVGIGTPRKPTSYIKQQWFSGTMNCKQTLDLFNMLLGHGYKDVTWVLQPNKFRQPGQPAYYISIGYTGVSEE